MDIIKPLPLHSIVIANEQTHGRGKPGSSWQSMRGNLLCSYKTYFQADLAVIYGKKVLQAVAGLACESRVKLNLRFKHPNDIYLDDKKLAGVLVEHYEGCAIVGIGVNLLYAPEGFACLADYGIDISSEHFLCRIFSARAHCGLA